MGAKGGKKKRRTLTDALARQLRLKAADGGEGTNYDAIARALVTAVLRGDTTAIKLAFERRDGPMVQKREVKHSARLLVQPNADPRARIVEADSVQDADHTDAGADRLGAGADDDQDDAGRHGDDTGA